MTEPPPPLDQDPSTSALLRSDLETAKEYGPRAYDSAAGLARFKAALGSGPAASEPQPPRADTPSTPPLGGALTSPWLWGGMLTLALTTGVLLWAREPAPAPLPDGTSHTRPASEPPTATVNPDSDDDVAGAASEKPAPMDEAGAGTAEGTAAAQTTTATANEQPAPAAQAASRASDKPGKRVPGTVHPPSAVPGTQTPDPLARETEQLARARRLLGQDPRAALLQIRASEAEFGDGMFGEEREALHIFALDRLGRHQEASARGTRFLTRHPAGPFSEEVRRITQEQEPTP